jgi:lysyl-tRNA synthetase class I
MWMKDEKWVPVPMFCSNCGQLNYGYRNDEEKIRYECRRCSAVSVRIQKGHRHDTIELYAPEGQVRYE